MNADHQNFEWAIDIFGLGIAEYSGQANDNKLSANSIDKYHQYQYEIHTYEYRPQSGDYVEADVVWPSRTLPQDDPRHRKNFLINRTMPLIKARLLRAQVEVHSEEIQLTLS